MKLAVLTTNSFATVPVKELASHFQADIYTKEPEMQECTWTAAQELRDLWDCYDGIFLIMSVNHAVRAVVPLLHGRALDPAVVVIDEKGQFAVSLLNGRLNEAESLARSAAEVIGGLPVVTSVINSAQIPMFEKVAHKNGFAYEKEENLPEIYHVLKNGGQVYLNSQIPIIGELEENILEVTFLDMLDLPENSPVILITNLEDHQSGSIYDRILQRHKVFVIRPRNLVLGVQCTVDLSAEIYEEEILSFMAEYGFSPLSLKAVTSMSEIGSDLLAADFADKYGAQIQTYTMDAVRMVEHMFPQDKDKKSNIVSCCCALCAGELPVAVTNDAQKISIAAAVAKERLIL